MKMTEATTVDNNMYILAVNVSNRPPAKQFPRPFRNPPQPHMCIHVMLQGSHTPCYINVMSWTRVELPLRPDAPIPLYGGMQVPFNEKTYKNFKQKPMVFAVMVNPEILLKNGKHSQSTQDRDSFIDLILEFVEAMNPSVQFTRRFDVLENRDLTGELKDIWAIVQIKRAKEKQENNKAHHFDENCQPHLSREEATHYQQKYGPQTKNIEIRNEPPQTTDTGPGPS